MAWQFFAIWIVTTFLSALLVPKQKVQNARPGSLGENVPYVTESDPIPVGWGTFWVKQPNIVWFGDIRMSAIKQKVSGGKK